MWSCYSYCSPLDGSMTLNNSQNHTRSLISSIDSVYPFPALWVCVFICSREEWRCSSLVHGRRPALTTTACLTRSLSLPLSSSRGCCAATAQVRLASLAWPATPPVSFHHSRLKTQSIYQGYQSFSFRLLIWFLEISIHYMKVPKLRLCLTGHWDVLRRIV